MRRLMISMLIVLALPAVSACGNSGAAPAKAASSSATITAGCASAQPGAPEATDDQERLGNLAGRIEQRGEADFSGVYAGARLAPERQGVEVYRKPSADFDKWILAEFAGDCVEVRDAKYSAGELDSRYQKVNDDTAYWAQQGIRVNGVSSDFVRGVVTVGTQDVEKAKAQFPARYGDGVPIEITEEGPA